MNTVDALQELDRGTRIRATSWGEDEWIQLVCDEVFDEDGDRLSAYGLLTYLAHDLEWEAFQPKPSLVSFATAIVAFGKNNKLKCRRAIHDGALLAIGPNGIMYYNGYAAFTAEDMQTDDWVVTA